MIKFKEGDNVTVINSYTGFNNSSVGKRGKIATIDNSSLPVMVQFDDGDYDWGCFEELQLELTHDEALDALAEAAVKLAEAQEEFNTLLANVRRTRK